MDKKINKYWKGELKPTEKRELIKDLDNELENIEQNPPSLSTFTDLSTARPVPYESKKMLSAIYNRINKTKNQHLRRMVRTIASISATIMFVSGIGFLWYLWQKDNDKEAHALIVSTVKIDAPVKDILLSPDSVPTLQLPNGEVKVLDIQGIIGSSVAGVSYSGDIEGERIYKVQQSPLDRSIWNTNNPPKMKFKSPKGYVNKLLFMDGTVAWLNSGASLEYPSVFSSNIREVKIEGEVYFQVARDEERPFIVQTSHASIHVLGTSFNVCSYLDEPHMTTTLVEGKVQLNYSDKKVSMMPGDQVLYDSRMMTVRKKKVDVAEYTSWKDGFFSFHGLTASEILTKVKRWYDIDEIIINTSSKERISGTFKYTKSLRSLLEKMEEISDVKFEIEERRVMVH